MLFTRLLLVTVSRVPEVGFEPTRPIGQSILSASRLPFRHSGQLLNSMLIPELGGARDGKSQNFSR